MARTYPPYKELKQMVARAPQDVKQLAHRIFDEYVTKRGAQADFVRLARESEHNVMQIVREFHVTKTLAAHTITHIDNVLTLEHLERQFKKGTRQSVQSVRVTIENASRLIHHGVSLTVDGTKGHVSGQLRGISEFVFVNADTRKATTINIAYHTVSIP